jgi:hypothetical protein
VTGIAIGRRTYHEPGYNRDIRSVVAKDDAGSIGRGKVFIVVMSPTRPLFFSSSGSADGVFGRGPEDGADAVPAGFASRVRGARAARGSTRGHYDPPPGAG